MDDTYIERLDRMRAAYDDLLAELARPEVAADHQRSSGLAKRAGDLRQVVDAYAGWLAARREAEEAKDLLAGASGAEEREYYGDALSEAQATMGRLEVQLVELLTPRDPRDDRPVIVEIRAGTGGEEAALFAGELLRMYQRFAERSGWRTDILDASDAPGGGIKEVVFEVRGRGGYSRLRHESGVHRVQRVPVTESSGRIHTSTATVAVLPEADEVSVQVAEDELKIDTYRASGPGGQHVNVTDSAVRITHLPTGVVVTCQSERSQRQNRERAMRILLAKLQERADAEARQQLASARREMVGTGERSEKIRTYNFPQNRVTDHRVSVTVHGIPQLMDGDIGDLLDTLHRHIGAEKGPVVAAS